MNITAYKDEKSKFWKVCFFDKNRNLLQNKTDDIKHDLSLIYTKYDQRRMVKSAD